MCIPKGMLKQGKRFEMNEELWKQNKHLKLIKMD